MICPYSRVDNIGYYAPEVFSNHTWSPAIDIYALAMCFIHLLSGCPPYSHLFFHDCRYGELDDNAFIKQAILTVAFIVFVECRISHQKDCSVFNQLMSLSTVF